MNQTIDLLLSRTSVRDFTDQKLRREEVDLLVQAAQAAPTTSIGRPIR
ncbi:nitroreductase [Streptococcus rupicaprae]|uniref:Nitroreductase n=1 Tax=Streptococcus rupicaprae TaxID=759619 RepID=A0ABV2FFL1_9STRE